MCEHDDRIDRELERQAELNYEFGDDESEHRLPSQHMDYRKIRSTRGVGGDGFISVWLGQKNNHADLVVWYFNHQDGGFFQGTYTKDMAFANKEYDRRVDRICYRKVS